VAKLGYDTPSPVQVSAIPLVLAGRDAIVQARTGSGKTLAFGLPLLSMLKPQSRPQALVVLPTRELAVQVCESLTAVSETSPLRVLPIYGGVGLGGQERALQKGVDVVVGTPGRLKDLIGRGSLDLGRVHVLVLDEADEMLDMGFRRDIEFLLDRLPALKQTLILSATMPQAIEAIARKHLKDPAVVKLVTEEVTPDELTHYYVKVPADQHLSALIALLKHEAPERAIIFTKMKHETRRLAQQLHDQAGIEAGFLNGNMSQNARNATLARFKAGEIRFLVATDVAARGLHVDGLTHVFHYAVPTVVETYIHRSGRTGRAGNEGKTITLVTPDAEADFKAIQKRVTMHPMPLDLASLPKLSKALVSPPPPPRVPRQAQARNPQPRNAQPRKPAPQEREVTWRKFKVTLPGAFRKNREQCHHWLAATSGLEKSHIRAVSLQGGHVTFEVASHVADRLVTELRRAMA
jgi:ATP-dependent RNA helicase DeaD